LTEDCIGLLDKHQKSAFKISRQQLRYQGQYVDSMKCGTTLGNSDTLDLSAEWIIKDYRTSQFIEDYRDRETGEDHGRYG